MTAAFLPQQTTTMGSGAESRRALLNASMARFTFSCQAGIRLVLMSMSVAPITFFVLTEPARMSKLSGAIFIMNVFFTQPCQQVLLDFQFAFVECHNHLFNVLFINDVFHI